MRVKRGVAAKRRHNKYLKMAKGYRGAGSRLYRTARERVEKALCHAYKDRKRKKREFRKLWIMRINAGARQNGLSYNQLIHGLKEAKISLNRKVLADLAVSEPGVFAELVAKAKEALAAV